MSNTEQMQPILPGVTLPLHDLVVGLGGHEYFPAAPTARASIDTFTPDQIEVAKINAQALAGDNSKAPAFIKNLYSRVYDRVPVDPITFFTSPKYLGRVGDEIFPLILTRLSHILRSPWITEVILGGAIGWGKCVDLQARVISPSGRLTTIAELVGMGGIQSALSRTDNGEVRQHQVLAAKSSGRKRVIRVTLDDGREIRCTPEHRVRVWDKRSMKVEWVEAQALNTSNHLVEGLAYITTTPTESTTIAEATRHFYVHSARYPCPPPHIVCEASNETLAHYLNLLFDVHAKIGNGKGLGSNIVIRSQEHQDLLDIQLLCLRFGIQTYVKQDFLRKDWTLTVKHAVDKLQFFDKIGFLPSHAERCAQIKDQYHGQSPTHGAVDMRGGWHDTPIKYGYLADAMIAAGYTKSTAEIAIPPKRKDIAAPRLFVLNWLKKYAKVRSDTLRHLVDAFRYGNTFIAVKSIEKVDESIEVGDLSLPGSHCFYANGICVHNSFNAVAGTLYEIYRLLCMRAPQRVFNNSSSSAIVFASLSVTEATVKNVIWDYLLSFTTGEGIFSHPDFEPAIARTESIAYWPQKNIKFIAGSSSENVIIGQNVIGTILDEANFLVSARMSKRARLSGEFDQATVLYNQLERRRTSRYLLPDGTGLARFWLVSSKQFPGDFLEKKIEEAKRAKSMCVLDYPQWLPRMTAARHPYGRKRFFLFLGNALYPSRILGDDTEVGPTLDKLHVPSGCKIQVVPHILKPKYITNLNGAIRDYSGWSVSATNPFFDDPNVYLDCVTVKDIGDVERSHPFSYEEPVGASVQHIQPREFKVVLLDDGGNKFDPNNLYHIKRREQFTRYPAINPHERRYVHVDLARNRDGAAIGMGHFAGYKQVVSLDVVDGHRFVSIEERPCTIYDWVIRFYAPPMGRIEPKVIRDVIWACCSYGHYALKCVSYDQWQSNESVDAFLSAGVESFVHSVDRVPVGYQLLRQGLIDKRISFYYHQGLFLDFSSLEYNNETGKVDHTATRADGKPGTKDLADCCAAIQEHIAADYATHRKPVPMQMGEFDHIDDTHEILRRLSERMFKGKGDDFMNAVEPQQKTAQGDPLTADLLAQLERWK